MAQQIINVGSAPNDGTGDVLRVSQQKANANFTELYNGAGVDSVQRNSFIWTTGLQTFTLTNIPNNVVFVSVQGQVLSETQYTIVGSTLTILDTLDVGNNIIVVFSYNAFNTVSTVNGMTGDVVLTKSDVGLSNVDNTSDINKPVSTAQSNAIAIVQNDINAHELLTNNPHSVTKAQVGLGNVDDTSDLNKPISTATQTALDLKQKKLNNLVVVNSITDFPAAASGVITLLANTTYFVTENIATSDRFILNSGTEIRSYSKYRPIFLEYTGTGNMFTVTNSSFIIRDIRIKAITGIVFSVSNSTIAHVVNLNFVNFDNCLSCGTIGGGNILLDDIAVINSQNGFIFNGTIFSLRTNLCFFREFTVASGICFDIPIGTTILSARFLQTEFTVNTGQKGLRVGAGVIPTLGGIIKSCKFQGTAPVSDRLIGVNGNSPSWIIEYGDNYGIAGIQFIDVEVISTADASLATGAGTYTEATTVRAYVLGIEDYDILATNMDAQVIALMTNPASSNVQIGLRNLTSATNDNASLGTATTGTLVKVSSVWSPITPNRLYNAFYVKATGVCTRFSLKIRIKVY